MSGLKTNIETHAFAWNAGEEPIEVLCDGDDPERLRHALMEKLGDKEFGKLVRSRPGYEFVLWYRAFDDQFRGRQIVGGTSEEELTAAVEARKQECSLKVFSPAELYALKPASVSYDPWRVVDVHLRNEISPYDFDNDAVEATNRVETRTLVDLCYDGRRTWTLQTVWFDDKPVMVVTSSGRDGDEYHDRWITDGAAFHDLVRFLHSFVKEDAPTDFVEASAKIPAMTEFYGHTIHDYYDSETQEPRKS